jgi:type IV secretion system protein VirB10
MTNDTQSNKKNGLPDIAELTHPRNIVFLVLALIVIITIFVIPHFMKSEKKPSRLSEETYVVQSAIKEQPKKKEINIAPPQQTAQKVTPPPVNPEVLQQQIALIQQKQKELQQRLIAPLMLVNTNNQQVGVAANAVQQKQITSKDPNMQFMNQVSAQAAETVKATTIGPLNAVIAEGSLIHATLESAINSDLPGYVRANVSAPVYSEDGSQVLIPPGSRLIGQYKSGTLQGQSRVFIVWTRLITSSGVSLQLGSPGVDSLAVAGMAADEINRHFWERFGTASLLSLIGAGAANLGVNGQDQNNSASQYREAVASSFAQSADQSLQLDIRIAPTLKKYQGQPIMVFVAKDLHFNLPRQSIKHNMNIF